MIFSIHSTVVGARLGRQSAAALLGGALTCVGSALPWLTFFAGLESFSGLVGLYGQVVLAGGVLAVGGGAAMLLRRDKWLRVAVGGLGVVLTVFVWWLLVGLLSTTQQLNHHATLVARLGPGLFVALAGTILIASAIWPGRSLSPSPHHNAQRTPSGPVTDRRADA